MGRISDISVQRFILRHLDRGGQRLSSLRLQIASGIRIHAPSDDILGTAQALASASAARRAEGYSRASEALTLMFDGMEASLVSMSDLIGDAREVAVAAGNDFGDGQDGRDALADQVDQILESALEVANARTAGRYVWGGTTPADVPFIAIRDADGAIIGSSVSAGSGEPITRFVGDRAVTLPVMGPTAFAADVDVIAELVRLRDAIRAGDVDAVRAANDALDGAEAQVGTAVASLGTLRAQHLASGDRLVSDRLRHEAARSRAMDTDIAEAMVLLEAEEASYEAALQMTVRLSDLSLLRYL